MENLIRGIRKVVVAIAGALYAYVYTDMFEVLGIQVAVNDVTLIIVALLFLIIYLMKLEDKLKVDNFKKGLEEEIENLYK